MTGEIVRVDDKKGFGFIRGADGAERFFHVSALVGIALDEIRPPMPVTFEPTQTPKGLRAETVRPA